MQRLSQGLPPEVPPEATLAADPQWREALQVWHLRQGVQRPGPPTATRDHTRSRDVPCLKCRSVFPTEQYLAAHVGEHPDCKAAFAASADNQIKRLRGTKGKGMPGSYRCGLCGDFFKKLRQIQTHQRVRHHDAFEKKYKCNICQKGFDLISDLTHHRSTHVLRGSKYDMDRDTKSSSSGTSAKSKVGWTPRRAPARTKRS
ncbi:putative zinc finger protein [Apostichopus japonicus]|uniref:Putative zinc finger protein n=1 Tax=Stichopus japonicus TaxID=307972 RepID=A0A2G8JC79_STIJA|nr:putative zinc finger protein [Apostichopus japonicus]